MENPQWSFFVGLEGFVKGRRRRVMLAAATLKLVERVSRRYARGTKIPKPTMTTKLK